MRSPHTATKNSSCSPQLEKARAQQRRLAEPGTHGEGDSGKCQNGNREISPVAFTFPWTEIPSIPWLLSPLAHCTHSTMFFSLSSSNLPVSFPPQDLCTCCPTCLECSFHPLFDLFYLLDLRWKGTLLGRPSLTLLFKSPPLLVESVLSQS